MTSVYELRARAAALSRHRAADDRDLQAARRLLVEALLRRAIEKALDADPPLSRGQITQLSRLLNGGCSPRGDR